MNTLERLQRPFIFEGNLDDEEEANAFLKEHTTISGRRLARRLGFVGQGSVHAASALSAYAWNKRVAANLRKRGEISSALVYETICDRLYRDDIQPNIQCW